MRGRKYSDEVKEKAYALYAICGNYEEVSRQIGVPSNTIIGWVKDKPPDGYEELRDQKRREFIDSASEIIELAIERLKNDLLDEDKPIPANHLTTVIGTLYDKRALASGDTTENVKVSVKLPEGLDEYAG